MQKKYFITGISTEVGKTVVSAIVTEALQADYWKPVQAGDIQFGDKEKVEAYISNTKTVVHPNSFALNTPMSPHASAEIDGVEVKCCDIVEPKTDNHLVVEGAGGLLVPLNDTETIADLIQPDYNVILVSKHYLGSINHTLLSFEYLKQKGIECSILFVGDEQKTTESIITTMTGAPILGRIPMLELVNKATVIEQAKAMKNRL